MPRAKAAPDPVATNIIEHGKDIHGKSIGGQKPSTKLPAPPALRTLAAPRRASTSEKERAYLRRLDRGDPRADPAHDRAFRSGSIEAEDRTATKRGSGPSRSSTSATSMDDDLPADLKQPERFLP